MGKLVNQIAKLQDYEQFADLIGQVHSKITRNCS